MSAAQIVKSILDGHVDDDFDQIQGAIRSRREYLAVQKGAMLKKGDKVRFADHIRPKYLAGLVATVKSVNKTTASVDIDDKLAAGRYGPGGCRCPFDLLEIVEADVHAAAAA